VLPGAPNSVQSTNVKPVFEAAVTMTTELLLNVPSRDAEPP